MDFCQFGLVSLPTKESFFKKTKEVFRTLRLFLLQEPRKLSKKQQQQQQQQQQQVQVQEISSCYKNIRPFMSPPQECFETTSVHSHYRNLFRSVRCFFFFRNRRDEHFLYMNLFLSPKILSHFKISAPVNFFFLCTTSITLSRFSFQDLCKFLMTSGSVSGSVDNFTNTKNLVMIPPQELIRKRHCS